MQTFTYLGTADDVVRRYPWKHGWDINSINHQLIHSVIYNQKLVINDGYIIANPELLDSLKNLNKSLLGNVLLSGSAVLFCRSSPKNLAEGLLKSRNNLITHEQALKGKNERTFIRRMETLQKYVNEKPVQWPRDKNMGAIFATFLDKLNSDNGLELTLPESLSKRDFEQVYKLFTDEMDENFDEARQHWERLCWKVFGNIDIEKYDPFSPHLTAMDCYPRVRTLMQVANEAYHMAYSSAMAWSLRENTAISKPLTSFCPAYLDVFKKSIIDDREDFLRYDNLGLILISVDLLKFGKDSNFSWIRELVLNDEIVEIREEYLTKLNRYMRWEGKIGDVQGIADSYRKALAKVVADSVPTYSDVAESIFNFFGGSQLVSILQAADSLRQQVGISTPINLDPVKSVKEVIEVREIDRRLKKPGLKSTFYGTSKQLARNLGLINAQLDQNRINEILGPIRPYNPDL